MPAFLLRLKQSGKYLIATCCHERPSRSFPSQTSRSFRSGNCSAKSFGLLPDSTESHSFRRCSTHLIRSSFGHVDLMLTPCPIFRQNADKPRQLVKKRIVSSTRLERKCAPQVFIGKPEEYQSSITPAKSGPCQCSARAEGLTDHSTSDDERQQGPDKSAGIGDRESVRGPGAEPLVGFGAKPRGFPFLDTSSSAV